MNGEVRRAPRLLYALGFGSLVMLALMLASAPGDARLAYQVRAPAETYVLSCSPCHGAAGEGSDFGPALAGAQTSVGDRISIITNGSDSMPAFGRTLSGEQIDELGAFLATLVPADDNLAAGGAIYSQQCAACHGEQGEGGAAPGLQDGALPLADLVAIIGDGRGEMPAYRARLTPTELEAVAAFAAALQGREPEPEPVPEPGPVPAEGAAQIYADHCGACHGPEGAGGLGPNLRTTTLVRDDIMAAVIDGVGTMPSYTGRLAAGEIEAVVTFVEGLAQAAGDPTGTDVNLVARGTELFGINCARCHAPDASGAFGPSLKYSTLTDVEIVSVISNGFGAMPSFADILTSADATALVAFVESTRGAGRDTGPVSAVALGRDVFVGSCATCHGFDGTGGVARSLANTRLTANEIISRVFGIHADRMPDFEGLLDAGQVQDVARYVLTIEAEPRSQVLWYVAGALALLVLIGGGIIWFFGLPGAFARRFR